ncbi:hypothetical protein T439DRAFT_378330 [Meredithblackwellia eburnea MCA 4105]
MRPDGSGRYRVDVPSDPMLSEDFQRSNHSHGNRSEEHKSDSARDFRPFERGSDAPSSSRQYGPHPQHGYAYHVPATFSPIARSDSSSKYSSSSHGGGPTSAISKTSMEAPVMMRAGDLPRDIGRMSTPPSATTINSSAQDPMSTFPASTPHKEQNWRLPHSPPSQAPPQILYKERPYLHPEHSHRGVSNELWSSETEPTVSQSLTFNKIPPIMNQPGFRADSSTVEHPRLPRRVQDQHGHPDNKPERDDKLKRPDNQEGERFGGRDSTDSNFFELGEAFIPRARKARAFVSSCKVPLTRYRAMFLFIEIYILCSVAA